MRFRYRRTVATAAVGLALVAGACSSSKSTKSASPSSSVAAKGKLTVGALNFSESAILAAIYAGALEQDGYDVSVRSNLGSREIVAPALERGEIDLYPGYAATDLEYYDNSAGLATPDPVATSEKLRSQLQSKALTALDYSPAVDTNAFAVTKPTAAKNNLTKLSDLAPVAGQLVLGGPPECPKRPFCALGLTKTYGLNFKEFKPVGLGVVADNALDNGDVGVTTVLSTDGLAREKFVILDDDKHLQNADNVIPVIRNQAATEEAKKVLNKVSAAITTDDLAQLNKRVDVDKEDAEAVAADWLEKHGYG